MKKIGGGKIAIYICHVKIYTNMMKDLQTKLKSKKAEKQKVLSQRYQIKTT
jgi:hypothetical protein